jgi:hypothetical protein
MSRGLVRRDFTARAGPRGDTPGYRWYDNAERTPASLLEEHEKGMITF